MEKLAALISAELALAVPVAVVAVLFVVFFGGIIVILFYIFKSVGIYRIAKTLGVKAPGLGWLPIFDWLILGRSADHIRKKEGAEHSGLGGWIFFLYILFIAGEIAQIVALGKITIDNIADKYVQAIETEVWFLPVVIVTGFIAVVIVVLQLIVLAYVYKAFSGAHVALFVLSFFFAWLIPVFLFAIRKNLSKKEKKKEEPQFEGLSQ